MTESKSGRRCSEEGWAGEAQLDLSVVIPVYNSEASLGELVERIGAVLESTGWAAEIVLVNDGSRDGSWAAIERASRRDGRVLGINLMRNYGQHSALLCGIRRARGRVVVTMDDDLQHRPEDMPVLVGALEGGYDVVYGSPVEERHGLMRDLASRLTKLALSSAMGSRAASKASAFRAFRTGLRGAFKDYHGPLVSIDVLLTWATTRFTAVEVRHEGRLYGESNYTLTKLVVHAMNMMTGFSVMPLQMASILGLCSTLAGLLVLVYVIGRYLAAGGSVPGFPFLASIIAVFSGVQMFTIGIIGEYLARVHLRCQDKPAYAVKEETGRSEGRGE